MAHAHLPSPNRLKFYMASIFTAAAIFTLSAAPGQKGPGQQQSTPGRLSNGGNSLSSPPDDSTPPQPGKVENGDSLDAPASDGNTAGYAVGESDVPDQAIVALNASAGPVRMARFSLLEGDVTWRADESLDWSAASINLPLRTGAQIWVAAGGHAEVQFDDGSYLRLGRGAVATLQRLYSDSTGEFTQVSLAGGVAMLQIKHDGSIYQIDAPLVSTRADGPARLRFGVGRSVEVGIPEGSATIEGAQGTATLREGEFVTVADGAARFAVQSLPDADSWEQWNRDRGAAVTDASQALAQHNLAPNIALVAGDLDKYGTWQTDAKYGEVWCSNVSDDKWRPYSVGHWVWVNPFGWTWCSDEPWGWAPYHYGTWFVSDSGWAWAPGPENQYWSPAVVHFTEFEGNVAWCALAPIEVHYPPASIFTIGVRSVRWSEYYSIGQAGCYYPSGDVYCVGRAFRSAAANTARYSATVRDPNTGIVTKHFVFAPSNNTYRDSHPFIPNNTVGVAGATFCKASAFGDRGPLTAVDRDSNEMFANGRSVGPPALGKAPVGGPPVARPTPSAFGPGASSIHRASESPTYTHRPVNAAPITNSSELMSNYWRVHPRVYTAKAPYTRPVDIGGTRDTSTGIGGSGGRGTGARDSGTGIGGTGGRGTGARDTGTGIGGMDGRGTGTRDTGTGIGGTGGRGTGTRDTGTGSGGTGGRGTGTGGRGAGSGGTGGRGSGTGGRGAGSGGTGGRGSGTGDTGGRRASSRVTPHPAGGASSSGPSGGSSRSGNKDSGTKDKSGKN